MKRNQMLIEADELLGKIDDPNLRIFDATIFFFRKEGETTERENYTNGHIPGAAFFDHQAFSDPEQAYMYMVLPEAKLGEQIGSVGIGKASEVVVYADGLLPCATRAWWLLHYAGHNNVRVLNGGLDAWKQVGGVLEEGENSYEPTIFAPHIRSDRMASKEEVLAAMENGVVCTVNTLGQESYDQGHIKESSLLPCMNLMEGMHTLLPNEILAEQLAAEKQYERVITYCGGGIAATVNAMAHLIAGNENVAVYDGSMSEWTGEGLPIGHGG